MGDGRYSLGKKYSQKEWNYVIIRNTFVTNLKEKTDEVKKS